MTKALLKFQFPTLVYQTPGLHQIAGGTYNYQPASSLEVLVQLLEAGWFLTLPEAIAGEHDYDVYSQYEEFAQPEEPEAPEAPAIPDAHDNPSDEDADEEQDEPPVDEPEAPETPPESESNETPADDQESSESRQDVDQGYDEQRGDEPADDEPPTRGELEIKAVELGIKFDGRTTDKSLAEKIEFVLSEGE